MQLLSVNKVLGIYIAILPPSFLSHSSLPPPSLLPPSSVRTKLAEELETSLLEASEAVPLFTYFVWKITALLSPTFRNIS